jgi:hypothetical protein
VLDEAAALLDPEDLVQRPARGAERARSAVQGGRQADDERDDRGAALLLGGFQRARDGIDRVRRGAGVTQIGGGIGDQALLAEDAERRGAEQQRREQRQQRVVRERRRVVGDLVLAEAAEGALEVPELDRGTGGAAVGDGRALASEPRRQRLAPKRLPRPYPPDGMPASRTSTAAMMATMDGRPSATQRA